jgi:hypothetical protein
MAIESSQNQVGRRKDTPASSGSSLYEAETAFLEYSVRSVENDLEQIRNNLGTTYAQDDGDPSPGEQQLLATYQKEIDILRGLLAHPRRGERSLERLLGDWLRHADDRLVDLARTARAGGGYDAAYWDLQRERDIHSALLRDWWHWLHGDAHERTPGGP